MWKDRVVTVCNLQNKTNFSLDFVLGNFEHNRIKFLDGKVFAKSFLLGFFGNIIKIGLENWVFE